jgi:DNA-binding MarR family transcriptional regulator
MDETKQVGDKNLMEQFFRLTRIIGRYHLHQLHNFGPFANPHRGQGRVLSILKLKTEITQKELGYLLDMRNQSLGELLNKLEKSGYITRIQSEEDKRTTIIKLTEAGTSAAEAADGREEKTELFDCLKDEEKAALYDYLERINAAIEKHFAENDVEEHGGFGPRGFEGLEHSRERHFDHYSFERDGRNRRGWC